MLQDPQNVPHGGNDVPLPRVGSTNPGKVGTFRSADDTFELKVTQNQTAGRYRREVRLNHKTISTDPLDDSRLNVSSSIIFTVDEPKIGYTNEELANLSAALVAWINVPENLGKLLGGEI